MLKTHRRLSAIVAVAALAALAGCGKGDDYTAPTTTTAAGCSTGSSCRAGSADPKDLVGAPAPAITGKNLTGPGELSLASYVGKPTAVVFWLNSCPHCQHDMPGINALQQSIGDSVQIVAVAIDAGLKGGKGFETPAAAAKTLKLTVPTILEPRAQADGDWHLASVPTAFILDARHNVVSVITRGNSDKNIAPDIRRALTAAQ
ncbi:MAG: hypothetical protein QOG90_29 [Actinomycetota bacterium]|jgi:thiol-disulfide isomerase/thioredoxin